LHDEQKLASSLNRKFGKACGATYGAGVKTTLALTLYDPEGKEMNESLAKGMEDAARDAGIPIELWKPLFELMRKSASYSDIKAEVFAMEQKVEAVLEK
jgi:hypothetical protein